MMSPFFGSQEFTTALQYDRVRRLWQDSRPRRAKAWVDRRRRRD